MIAYWNLYVNRDLLSNMGRGGYTERDMYAFLSRNYSTIFFLSLGLLMGLAFYVGYLEGKEMRGTEIVLSCSPTTLSALTIPAGALSAAQNESSTKNQNNVVMKESSVPSLNGEAKGTYVGSKNGTKYYSPGCSTVKRIKPENYVWFQDSQDAILQGYSPGTC